MTDEQLPETLAQLFAAERAAPVASGAAKAAVKAKVAASIAGLPLGAGASILGATGKLIGVLAIGVGIGAAAVGVSRRSGSEQAVIPPLPRVEIVTQPDVERIEPDYATAPDLAPPPPAIASDVDKRRPSQQSPRPTAPLEPVDTPAPLEAPPVSAPPVQALVADVLPPSPPSQPPSVQVPSALTESAFVKQAWSALSGRDPATALRIVGNSERAYPNGVLTEERDAIRIAALSQLRRRDEMRAAANRFLSTYPQSIHRSLVQRALEETP